MSQKPKFTVTAGPDETVVIVLNVACAARLAEVLLAADWCGSDDAHAAAPCRALCDRLAEAVAAVRAEHPPKPARRPRAPAPAKKKGAGRAH